MAETNAAIARLNQWNAHFWTNEKRAIEEKLSDQATFETAMDAMASELRRQVPPYSQMTFEAALRAAEQAQRRSKSQFGRKGGKTKRPDALQQLIETVVQRRPTITASELLERLRADQQCRYVVEQVHDGIIDFIDNDEKLKDAPVSGLKDRLSRAKKKLRSR